MKKNILMIFVAILVSSINIGLSANDSICRSKEMYENYTSVSWMVKTQIHEIGDKLIMKRPGKIDKYVEVFDRYLDQKSKKIRNRDIVGILKTYFVCRKGISGKSINQTYIQLPLNSSFDWILSERIDPDDVKSKVIDLDREDTSKQDIERHHEQGKIVIAYVSVGSYENWRSDKSQFDEKIIGNKYPGWDGEKFLDIGNHELFSDIIEARFDIIKEKGFDGIEPDNMDLHGWDYETDITGFSISKSEQLDYAKYLAQEAHKRGLFIIQKNAEDLAGNLVDYYDGALLEGAFHYNFASEFEIYIKNNKPVFNTEYSDDIKEEYFLKTICVKSKQLTITSIFKNRELDRFIINCPLFLDFTK